MKKIDYLIVGCGLFGSVLAERITNVLKKKVIILEKRDHIAGNIYSHIDPYTGIEYHKYGTHIFHTSNSIVWDYLNQFTSFNSYRHQSLAKYKNKIYQLPINLETINSFFNKNYNPDEAKKFITKVTKNYRNEKNYNFETKALSQIGKDLYEAFIKNYTKKQWGKDPINLPGTIFNRLPLRFNYDETYQKNSRWSGVPEEGYTNFVKKLLDSKQIEVKLNNNFDLKNNLYNVKYFTIYTGPLDKLFDYQHGKLDWRSLKFEKKVVNTEDFQGNSVINYPELKYKFTRIHEPKHLHPERNYFKKNKTIIIKEYPKKDYNEPYYPINDLQNRQKQKKYSLTAKGVNNFLFGGRLANYAYYDMDMTILAALTLFKKIKKITA